MLPGLLNRLRFAAGALRSPGSRVLEAAWGTERAALFRQANRAGGESIRGAMEWALSGGPITAPLSAAGRVAGSAVKGTLRGAISPIGRPLTGAVIGGVAGFATEDGSMEDRVVSGMIGAGIGAGAGILSTRVGKGGGKALGRYLFRASGGRDFAERYRLQAAMAGARGSWGSTLQGRPRSAIAGLGGSMYASSAERAFHGVGVVKGAGAAWQAAGGTLGESGAMLPAALRGTAKGARGMGAFAIAHPRATLFGAAGVVGGAYAMGGEEYRPAVLEQPERGIGAEEMTLPGGGTGMIVGPRNPSLTRLQNSTAGLVQNLHAGRHRGR